MESMRKRDGQTQRSRNISCEMIILYCGEGNRVFVSNSDYLIHLFILDQRYFKNYELLNNQILISNEYNIRLQRYRYRDYEIPFNSTRGGGQIIPSKCGDILCSPFTLGLIDNISEGISDI